MKSGPDHKPAFICYAKVYGEFNVETIGKGLSKKSAKIEAGKKILVFLQDKISFQSERGKYFENEAQINYEKELIDFCSQTNIGLPIYDYLTEKFNDVIIHTCKSRADINGEKIHSIETASTKRMAKYLAARSLLEKVKALHMGA